MSIFSEGIYRFNVIPVKPQEIFFKEVDKMILKYIHKSQGLRISRTLQKKAGRRGVGLQMPQ